MHELTVHYMNKARSKIKIKRDMKRTNSSFLICLFFVDGVQMTADLMKSTSDEDFYLSFCLAYNNSTKSEVFLIRVPAGHHMI